MGGGLRQAAEFTDQVFPAELAGFVDGLALDQLGEGGAASDGRNATFGAEANVDDTPAFELSLIHI